MNAKLTVFAFILVCFGHTSMAQTINSVYVEDVIVDSLSNSILDSTHYNNQFYIKVDNAYECLLAEMNTIKVNPVTASLYELLSIWEVSNITQPFKVLQTPIFDRIYQMEFTADGNIDSLLNLIEAYPYIEYAEKIPIIKTSYIPND